MSFVKKSIVGVVMAVLIVVTGATSAQAAAEQDQVATSVNAQRSAAGVPALRRDATLDAAAQQWAQTMSNARKMYHSTNEWRAARIPTGWNTHGENVAHGYSTATGVMSGWMNSDGHRANILRSSYTRIGVGYVASGNFWVQIFAGYKGDTAVSAPVTPVTSGSVPVYRFWSPVYQGHFFTTSASERDSVKKKYPGIWSYEGERYRAFSTQVAGTIPVYRFWSAKLNGHFYTTSESEKNLVNARYDDFTWKYEKVAYYVYPVNSTAANTSVVARFWSPTYQHHFYTANAGEAAKTKTYPARIWTYENNAFRVPR